MKYAPPALGTRALPRHCTVVRVPAFTLTMSCHYALVVLITAPTCNGSRLRTTDSRLWWTCSSAAGSANEGSVATRHSELVPKVSNRPDEGPHSGCLRRCIGSAKVHPLRECKS
jgi:hypothetical protein